MEERETADTVSALETLRGLLESVSNVDHGNSIQAQNGSISENVAQLIAVALAQVSQSLLPPAQLQTPGSRPEGSKSEQATQSSEGDKVNVLSEDLGTGGLVQLGDTSMGADNTSEVEREVEVAASDRPRPLCVKFPTSVRAQIVTLRKEGRRYKDIARELGVSVSGVQKVWERFLATGMIHDRKPSSYAGRPRKYNQKTLEESGEEGSVPSVFLTPGPSDELTENCEDLTTPTQAVLVAAGDDGEAMFSEEPMDVPGATVEVVSSACAASAGPTTSTAGKQTKKKSGPAYRQELLMRLVDGCPLALLKAGDNASGNAHVQNLASSVHKPLYMEYVLGHPFGKVPSPQPFEPIAEESLVILSDPCNPLGKEVLAAMGYSTKVFFNACCKPSPLFDQQKVLNKLPLSVGPSHLAPAMQTVLQLMLDLCTEPAAALNLIPDGKGPPLFVYSEKGDVISRGFLPPDKLSDYWSQLYTFASLFQCCENFLSASPPSSPCLLCHPFESFAHTLHIKDPSPPPAPITPDSPHEPLDSHPSLPLTLDDSRTEASSLDHQRVEDAISPPLMIVPSTTSDSISTAAVLTQDSSAEREADTITLSPKPDITDEIQYVAYSASAVEQETDKELSQSYLIPPIQPRRSQRRKRTLEIYCDKGEGVTDQKQQSKKRQMSEVESCAGKSPADWTIEEVAVFIDSVPYCNLGSVFQDHEVNGESLLSMNAEMMVKMMGIKAGPAVRIQRKLTALKQEFGIQ